MRNREFVSVIREFLVACQGICPEGARDSIWAVFSAIRGTKAAAVCISLSDARREGSTEFRVVQALLRRQIDLAVPRHLARRDRQCTGLDR